MRQKKKSLNKIWEPKPAYKTRDLDHLIEDTKSKKNQNSQVLKNKLIKDEIKKKSQKNSKKIKIKRIRIKFKRKKLWIILNWRDKLKIKINFKKQLKGKTTIRMRIKSKKIKNLDWRIRLKSIESF